jgi:phosphate transport system substrate-binding protein
VNITRYGRTAGAIGTAGLAVLGMLALAACGSDNNSSPSASASSSTTSSGAASGGITCASGTLTASGSTAQANAISAWTKAYQTACTGATINYGGGGSGAGVTQFTAGSVDFAGSDFPLSSDQKPAADNRCGSGNQAVDLPMVPGPIAVGYNVPGVTNLQLSASTLAKIFAGKITKWDDAAIKADNAGVTLPSLGIQTFHRSDGSGTSYNFTNYLMNDAKADWTYGVNKNWPAPGGQGAKGSSAVAQGVKSTAGGIGYFELSYATQSSISTAKVGNGQGAFIAPTTDGTVAFLSKATVVGTNGDLALSFDYTNPDTTAYPAVLVTYEIVCAKGNKAAQLPLIKSFLTYISSTAGQAVLPDNGYVKLPDNLQQQVSAAVATLG